MLQPVSIPIRKECPPGACVCDRDALLAAPDGDTRILRLTQEEEKRLIARIDSIASYSELKTIEERMQAQLGIIVQITPSNREVRSVRGFNIQVMERPGLCRKTRQTIPAAIRRCLERNPDIAFAILDENDLFGSS